MATAGFLSIVLVYLVGLRQADKRGQKVSREIQWLKGNQVCCPFDI